MEPSVVCSKLLTTDAARRTVMRCGTRPQRQSWRTRLTVQAPFAEEPTDLQKRNHSFLAVLGYQGHLEIAALYVKDGVDRIVLREQDLIFLTVDDRFARADFRQKDCGIKPFAAHYPSVDALHSQRDRTRQQGVCIALLPGLAERTPNRRALLVAVSPFLNSRLH
jgi:hypothetical protein